MGSGLCPSLPSSLLPFNATSGRLGQALFARTGGSGAGVGQRGTSCCSCCTAQMKGAILLCLVREQRPCTASSAPTAATVLEPSIPVAAKRSSAGIGGVWCWGERWRYLAQMGRRLLPLSQTHSCWHCWCLWRDGELLGKSKAVGAYSIPASGIILERGQLTVQS